MRTRTSLRRMGSRKTSRSPCRQWRVRSRERPQRLEWTLKSAKRTGRFARWKTALILYHFSLHYRPETQNKMSDNLSRYPMDPGNVPVYHLLPFPKFNAETVDVQRLPLQDEFCFPSSKLSKRKRILTRSSTYTMKKHILSKQQTGSTTKLLHTWNERSKLTRKFPEHLLNSDNSGQKGDAFYCLYQVKEALPRAKWKTWLSKEMTTPANQAYDQHQLRDDEAETFAYERLCTVALCKEKRSTSQYVWTDWNGSALKMRLWGGIFKTYKWRSKRTQVACYANLSIGFLFFSSANISCTLLVTSFMFVSFVVLQKCFAIVYHFYHKATFSCCT